MTADAIKIPLTRGQVAIIDAEDFSLVCATKWYAKPLPHGNFAAVNKRFGSSPMYMHRVILQDPPEAHIDHINGNSLDNRKINLRACSCPENTQNRTRMNSNNASGVHGVSWYSNYKKWVVYINVNKTRKTLGYYESLEDARKARTEAERIFYGEFAPQGGTR